MHTQFSLISKRTKAAGIHFCDSKNHTKGVIPFTTVVFYGLEVCLLVAATESFTVPGLGIVSFHNCDQSWSILRQIQRESHQWCGIINVKTFSQEDFSQGVVSLVWGTTFHSNFSGLGSYRLALNWAFLYLRKGRRCLYIGSCTYVWLRFLFSCIYFVLLS